MFNGKEQTANSQLHPLHFGHDQNAVFSLNTVVTFKEFLLFCGRGDVVVATDE